MRLLARRLTSNREWRHFERWCRERRLRALPAHPWTVAAYMRWCETRAHPDAIGERLQAISKVHVLSGRPTPEHHPMVMRTLGLVERRVQQRGARAALFKPADAGTVRTDADDPLRPALRVSTRRRALRGTPRLVRRTRAGDDA
ncbi:MAG: hypothetical protein O3A88_01270 [Proteobacteria bacterium]|nr:hypothetical protein [Pseudomonadota bacterium]